MVHYIEIPEPNEVPLDQMPEGAVGGVWDCANWQWEGTWFFDEGIMCYEADQVGRSGLPLCVLDAQGEYVEESGF